MRRKYKQLSKQQSDGKLTQ